MWWARRPTTRVKIVPCVVVMAVGLCALNPPAAAETTINAVERTQDVSLDPFDPIWRRTPKNSVPLMPQTLFAPRGGGATTEVVVQALRTATSLSLRLEWGDSTQASAQEAHRTEGFDDAVAVQFPLYSQEALPSPFMGDLQHPVTIWHWKASWQERLDLPAAPPGERESAAQAGMASAHPRTVRDEERFAKEPTFRTGEAVGNLFSQPARQSSVEHLIASGFGTLTTTQAQPVEGRGVWRNGRWHVVMRRLLAPQDAALEVDFRQLVSIPVGLAIWDGSHQERDGMKSVSVWQTLVFPRRTPWWERIRRLIAPPAGLPTASVENHRIQRHAGIVDHGQRVFARLGCAACHGSEGRGGVRNPNALTAEEVPPLIGVAKRFTEEELKEKLLQGAAPARLDPRAPSPGRWMPTWHPVLDDGELEALTAYLVSLVPEDVEAW